MNIIFSLHARIKIKQRKISPALAFATVRTPDFVRPGYGFREEFYKRMGSKYLKAVIKRERKRLIVVTVRWVAKVKNK